MKQVQEIFKRYEKKYLLDEKSYRLISRGLEGRMLPDEYGESIIRSLYFDTPDRRLIRASLEKPVYKEKLRLRGYGAPGKQDAVFVELKKKYKGVVYKRRVDMPLCEAEDYLINKKGAANPSQITAEIDWFLSFYPNIEPAMLIACKRTAFYGIRDENLRVTFDRDILWKDGAPRLDARLCGTPLLSPGIRLMEIKIPGAMPLWLSALLGCAGAYPVSFSKYGRGYEQSKSSNNNGKGGILCA